MTPFGDDSERRTFHNTHFILHSFLEIDRNGDSPSKYYSTGGGGFGGLDGETFSWFSIHFQLGVKFIIILSPDHNTVNEPQFFIFLFSKKKKRGWRHV